MIMTILLVLILWATTKTVNLRYPARNECSQQLVSRAQRLAKWRHSIEEMPNGFNKIQEQKRWMLEVEKLIAESETVASTDSSSSIVNVYQLRKN